MNEQYGLHYLQPSLFLKENNILAGFSTRQGGVSRGAFASLNLAFHTGDNFSSVWENRQRFLSIWNISPYEIISGNQVHGTAVHLVKDSNCYRGGQMGVVIPACDALISNLGNVTLAAFSADCLIIFLFEPEKKVISLVHAGWRGVLHGIMEKVIDILKKDYYCNHNRIIVAVSPGICFKCFEVGEDVAVEFWNKGWDDPLCIKKASAGRYFINLKEISRRQLINGGLCNDRIDVSDLCTACFPDLFYSYRGEGGKTGRMMAFLTLMGKNLQ